jgi:hypothetical protein
MSFSLKGEIVFQIEENFILGRVIFLEGKSFIASYMIYHVFLFCVWFQRGEFCGPKQSKVTKYQNQQFKSFMTFQMVYNLSSGCLCLI